MGIGDSTMYGAYGAPGGPMASLSSYLGMTYTNQAIDGTCSATGVSDLPGWLASYTPQRVYVIYGVNDIGWIGVCGTGPAPTVSQFITNYTSYLSDCTSTGATLYPSQIIPTCYYCGGANLSQTIKIWNANLEDWAYTNNLSMSPTYLEMSSMTTDDCLGYTATGDTCVGTHPSATGDGVAGYLMYHAAIPTRSRDWGSSSYPNFGHESFSWWVLSGSATLVGGTSDSVTGHIKGGTLTLGASDSAASPVLSILPSNNSISITLTGTGLPTIYYRTSTNNFTRTAASPSWVQYTGAFSLISGTAQLIQIQIVGTSATALATLNWNGTPLTIYTIAGTISGAVQSGVTVNLMGTTSAATTTASDGTYSFTGLSAGSYTITPGKTGYTFTPTTLSPTITSSNVTGENFNASAVVASGSARVVGSFSGTVQ